MIAKADTRYSLDELQRQFAYDRALARLFTAPLDTDGSSLMGPGHHSRAASPTVSRKLASG